MTTVAAHPDARALLRGVLDAPADDLPRLVLADWLEENGRPKRADFIRVQCRLAELQAANPVDFAFCSPKGGGDRECEICRLKHREAELTADLAAELFPSEKHVRRKWETVPGWGEVPLFVFDSVCHARKLWFRRGFVAEIRSTLSSFYGGQCLRCQVPGGESSGLLCPFPMGASDAYDSPGLGWDCRQCYLQVRAHHPCPACSGTARTVGVAADLFAEHPVDTVVLVDREPFETHDGGRAWLDSTHVAGDVALRVDPSRLPMPLFQRLRKRSPYLPGMSTYHSDTVEAAKAALSDACVAYGEGTRC